MVMVCNGYIPFALLLFEQQLAIIKRFYGFNKTPKKSIQVKLQKSRSKLQDAEGLPIKIASQIPNTQIFNNSIPETQLVS